MYIASPLFQCSE